VAAPGQRAFDQALAATRPGGRIVSFAATSPGETVELDLGRLTPLEKSVLTRVTTVNALSQWLRGRLALHTPGTDAETLVHRAIAKLPKIDNPRAGVFADLLRAGLAMRVDLRRRRTVIAVVGADAIPVLVAAFALRQRGAALQCQ